MKASDEDSREMSNEISIKVGDSSDLQLGLESLFLHIRTPIALATLKISFAPCINIPRRDSPRAHLTSLFI